MVWKMTCRPFAYSQPGAGRNLSVRCTPTLAFSQMWFSQRYWRADVQDQCFLVEKTLLFQAMQAAAAAAENAWACGSGWTQIKQCFTFESLKRIGAYLGQRVLNFASIWLRLLNFFLRVWKISPVFWRSTAVPHCRAVSIFGSLQSLDTAV